MTLLHHRSCSHHAMHDAFAKDTSLHTATSPKPLPFRHIGPFDRVLVAGIPVLECPSCRKKFPDLELLVTIEDVLEQRVGLGDARPLYLFADIAPEVFAALDLSQSCPTPRKGE